MKASELMTPEPLCCTPDQTVQETARLMRDNDCGCIPVIEDSNNKRLIGVVTDRDITVRGLAEGKAADTPVRDVMTRDPKVVRPDDDVQQIETIMAQHQVRRVPVVDRNGSCVGIVSQADLALNERAASDQDVGRVVERISEPG